MPRLVDVIPSADYDAALDMLRGRGFEPVGQWVEIRAEDGSVGLVRAALSGGRVFRVVDWLDGAWEIEADDDA